MTAAYVHRLDGLEPDNLLAFLALLGTLRALEASPGNIKARISWSLRAPPVRPWLHLDRPSSQDELSSEIAQGVSALAAAHQFDGRADLTYVREECSSRLEDAARIASSTDRGRADLLSALMHDAAMKDGKPPVIDPTPLCLLFGQGHQHFLERLSDVPRLEAPPPRGRNRSPTKVGAADCVCEALFHSWHRSDPTKSFRWDPLEEVRYATMAGDPTDTAFKSGTQHGANRLAAVGLAVMTLASEHRAGRVRPLVVAGSYGREGFSIAWPIWSSPASLAAIAALLSHPRLRDPEGLRFLGVEQVMVARRISVGKFMNFARARALV